MPCTKKVAEGKAKQRKHERKTREQRASGTAPHGYMFEEALEAVMVRLLELSVTKLSGGENWVREGTENLRQDLG